MTWDTYCISTRFEAAGPATFRMDRHYFVHALSGVMRLEADGMRWTLPPARGALIAAGHPVDITILSPVATASVLFGAGAMMPRRPLVVFEVSPLCRELVRVCRAWGETGDRDAYATQAFAMLAAEVGMLALTPSLSVLNAPRDPALRRALAMAEAHLSEGLAFDAVARAVGRSPRTLARRFADEMGQSWRDTLRRMRVIRAMELLAATDAQIADVAFQVGYGSLSGFNAAFREFAGCAPGDYRRSLAPR